METFWPRMVRECCRKRNIAMRHYSTGGEKEPITAAAERRRGSNPSAEWMRGREGREYRPKEVWSLATWLAHT